MSIEEKDPAESESEAEETEESESEEKEPTIKELMAEIADLKKQLTPSKEESEESESEDKGKEKPKVDPLHVDYAEYLKAQMGKSYPKEFDKLPLDVRIPAMKATLSAVVKKPNVKEGTVAKGTPIDSFTPPGTNYKDIAKKIRSGQ